MKVSYLYLRKTKTELSVSIRLIVLPVTITNIGKNILKTNHLEFFESDQDQTEVELISL